MTYETHDLEQGSDAWLAHRSTCYNASDLAAAMGTSRYKTRSALIAEIATGSRPEVDARTQKRFDDGHRFEALARPLAEEVIGEDLFPASVSLAVAGLNRRIGASYDGKTMADTANWEHKTLNDALAASLDMGVIPDEYHPQMEQGMLINGAERCLFSASKWDENDQLIDIKHVWYASNPNLRAAIIPTWQQIEHDATNYRSVEVIPPAVAAPTLDLPVVSIQTSGAIAVRSNLRAFGEALNAFIDRLPTKPSTDQEFADCKAALAKLKIAEDTLESEEARALSQMTEIDEMRREKKLYQDLARTTRLALEKLVAARESAIKAEIIQEGKDKLAAHIAGLNKRLARVQMPAVVADFQAAIKSKRTVAALRNAVDTLLAAKRIETNEIADRIQINLATIEEQKDYAFLFSDLAILVMKAQDDLQAVIANRIARHQAEQEKKLEEERARIRADEQARTERASAETNRLRIASITARIDDIRRARVVATTSTPEAIQTEIERIEAIAIDETFQEYATQAEEAKSETLQKLADIRAAKTMARDMARETSATRGNDSVSPEPIGSVEATIKDFPDSRAASLRQEINNRIASMAVAKLELVLHYIERMEQHEQAAA